MKTEIVIDEYIIAATSKCEKEFCCLSGRRECICEVSHVNGNHTVQVKCATGNSCKYKFHLGSKLYCLCPVRNELYNRYKI